MRVCRTCLQVLSGDASFVLLDADDCLDTPSIRSKLLVCVPELAMDVRCAVICTACSNALNTAYDFKNKCLRTEERILNYAQYTGCSTNAVNISEVVQFNEANTENGNQETKPQLVDVRYPITQIIESDVDMKPLISCDTPVYQQMTTGCRKVEAGEFNCQALSNGMEALLPSQVFFSPELEVEVRSYRTPGLDIIAHPEQTAPSHDCIYCPKTFPQPTELDAHLATHAENRPLKCSLCERRFVRKDKLQLHMRIHTGEKPFECTLCGRCFSRKDKLNNHVRTHTGEKPHQCILCQKSFARKDKMNTHMRSQHWLALANLEITVVKREGVAEAGAPETSTSQ